VDDCLLQPLDGPARSDDQQADGKTRPRWRGAKRPRHQQIQQAKLFGSAGMIGSSKPLRGSLHSEIGLVLTFD